MIRTLFCPSVTGPLRLISRGIYEPVTVPWIRSGESGELVRVVFCWLAQPKPAVQASIITAARGITLCFIFSTNPHARYPAALGFQIEPRYLLAKSINQECPFISLDLVASIRILDTSGQSPGFLRRRIRTVGELPVCWFLPHPCRRPASPDEHPSASPKT